MDGEKRLLDISWGSILKVSVAAIAFYVLYQIRDILVWFIFALIISILFSPAVDFLRRLKIPRVLAIIFLYIGFFGIFSLLVYSLTPMFISEIGQFSQFLPQYFEKVSPPLKWLGFEAFEDMGAAIDTLEGILNSMAGNILNTLFAIFGGILTTVFILTMAVFLSLEEKGVEKALTFFFPKEHETYILSLWRRCQKKISNWFITRIVACLFVGVASSIAFFMLNVHYPITLGLLAGALNFIPFIGPLITGIILFAIIALDNWLKAIFVLVVSVLVQLIENNILTPILSQKLIELSPVLVLMAIAIGGVLWGPLGSILAIPLLGILFEFLKDFFKEKEEEPSRA